MSKINLLPIRKVVVGLAAQGIVLGARKAFHIDLVPDTVADIINVAVGPVVSYIVEDPRVRSLERKAEAFLDSPEIHPILVQLEPTIEQLVNKAVTAAVQQAGVSNPAAFIPNTTA